MAKQKTGSAGDKARYQRYKNEMRLEKNKRLKVARHVKQHPNDEQNAMLVKGTSGAPRSTPKATTVMKSKAWKAFAHTLRMVTGNAKNIEQYTALTRTVYDRPVRD